MADPETEGLLRAINDSPFFELMILADKTDDAGDTNLAAAYRWLAAWKKTPEWDYSRSGWIWCRQSRRGSRGLPEEVVKKINKCSLNDFFYVFATKADAYIAAANWLATTEHHDVLNQRPDGGQACLTPTPKDS